MPDTMVQTDIEDPEYLGKARQPKQPKSGAISITAKDFATALGRVGSMMGRGMDIPILKCVRLTITNGTLRVEATNMEVGITLEVPVQSDGALDACVNAAMLSALVQKLPPGSDVSLELKDDKLVVRNGTTVARFTCLPVDEFPVTKTGHFAARFSLPSATLSTLIERTRPFVSNEATRYYLCGVFIGPHMVDGVPVMRAAATNGNELGATYIPEPEGYSGAPPIIIPGPTVNELARMLDATTSDIAVSVSDARIVFSAPGVTLFSKLIDGAFPDFDRIVPRSNANVLLVDRRAMLNALALAVTASDGRTPSVRITVSPDRVAVQSDSVNDSVVAELPAGTFDYQGAEITAAFFYRTLNEVTKLCGIQAKFWFEENVPFLARDPDDDAALYVGMSLRK